MRPVENLSGLPKIESPLLERPPPLGTVEGNPHGIYRSDIYLIAQPVPPRAEAGRRNHGVNRWD